MMEFSIFYMIGCLIALPIGVFFINKFDNSNKPVFDSLDNEIKIALHRMTIFMFIVSSWLSVLVFLLFKTIIYISKNKNTLKNITVFFQIYVISPFIIILGVSALFNTLAGTSDIDKWNWWTEIAFYVCLIYLFKQNDNQYHG